MPELNAGGLSTERSQTLLTTWKGCEGPVCPSVMFSLSQAQMAVAQGQPGYNGANLGTAQGGILPVGPSAEQVTAADM